jgi:O-antigen ligase
VAENSQCISQKHFVTWFVATGILVPVSLIVAGTLAETRLQWEPQGAFGMALWILTWIIWPTWIFMIDAAHLAQTIVMLIVSASLNGLYYGVLGFLIWHVQHRIKPQSSLPIS